MKRLLLLTTSMILAGAVASAAVTPQSLVSTLSAQGYTRIEVKTGITQIKVEAIKGTTKLETIYDIATGQVLKSETEAVNVFDDTAPGVEISTRNRDFLRVSGSDDDGNDDNGGGDDDGNDDHGGGDDDGGDDDSNDDDSNDDDGDNSGHGSDNSGHGSGNNDSGSDD